VFPSCRGQRNICLAAQLVLLLLRGM